MYSPNPVQAPKRVRGNQYPQSMVTIRRTPTAKETHLSKGTFAMARRFRTLAAFLMFISRFDISTNRSNFLPSALERIGCLSWVTRVHNPKHQYCQFPGYASWSTIASRTPP